MSQFYAITQEPTEMVPKLVIRFQHWRKQLMRSPTPEQLTGTFLTALWEALHTTLVVVDLTGKRIENVISRVLRLNNAQNRRRNPASGRECIAPHASTSMTLRWSAHSAHIA